MDYLGTTVAFLSRLIGSLAQTCQCLSLPIRVYYYPKGHEDGIIDGGACRVSIGHFLQAACCMLHAARTTLNGGQNPM